IGKGTIETLEQLALAFGLSLWRAIGEAVKQQLLSPRAVTSLKNFQQVIEDARAMLAGTFTEELQASSVDRAFSPADAEIEKVASVEQVSDDEATAFDPEEFDNFSFDFAPAAAETNEENTISRDSVRHDNDAAGHGADAPADDATGFPVPTV